MKKKNIWVAGFPSFVGGADTELLHNIDMWSKKNVSINLVPMFGINEDVKKYVLSIGCKIHQYQPKIFKNKTVVSYCNGEFLSRLPEIMNEGKPKAVIWFNCMTWAFEKELEAHKNGYIDYFGFVSEYQKKYLLPKLQKVNLNTNILEGYRPYFNPENICQNINFNYRQPLDYFGVGRISRDDPTKFSEDMWNIFYKISTQKDKKIFILGYNEKVEKKTGTPPNNLDWMYWSPGVIHIKELHEKIHCIVHKTGGSRESYCRIVPEAYAFGTPIIVENNYAFPELIIDNETGYLCNSSDEMSYRASELAFNEKKRKQIIFKAREHLINNISNIDICWQPWGDIL